MLEALTKAYNDVHEKDEEKLLKRKSKRIRRITEAELNDDDIGAGTGENEAPPTRDSIASIPKKDESVSSFDIVEDDDDILEDREKWENEYIVIFHMIGFAVGGSNVWDFGYLCYTYGGAAFLIPYLLLTLVCALPCVYLELLIGQYSQVGAIAAWKLSPLFKGVGMCMVLVAFMTCFNIQAILTWSTFYLFQATFYSPLPWISCDNGFGKKPNGLVDVTKTKWVPDETIEDENKNWHTENCTEFVADVGRDGSLAENERLPGTEYFRGRVQRMWRSGFADRDPHNNFSSKNGVLSFGIGADLKQGILEYNYDTMICLLVVCILMWIFILKGIKINAKVMVYLVLMPYAILALLFYRATGLTGARFGIEELFKPNLTKLIETETWWRCAEQVFYSTGAGFGVHLVFASHNHFARKVAYDALIVVIVDAFTSFLSASTIFMFLGHVSVAVNREIGVFVRAGPELMFEVMSDVLGVLASSNFYAFSFYLAIFLFAFTTVITVFNGAVTSYLEVLPVTIKYKTGSRFIVEFLLYITSFIATSLCITRGGLHTFNFISTFVGLYSIILTALLFMIGSTWFFGLREIVDATEEMHIRLPGVYFQICWKFISPVVLLIIFVGLVTTSASHTVTFDGKALPLDKGLQIIGYSIAIGPCLVILGAAIHTLWQAPGATFREKWLLSISPKKEHVDILVSGTSKRAHCSHFFYFYASTGVKCNICYRVQNKGKVAPEFGGTDYGKGHVDEEQPRDGFTWTPGSKPIPAAGQAMPTVTPKPPKLRKLPTTKGQTPLKSIQPAPATILKVAMVDQPFSAKVQNVTMADQPAPTKRKTPPTVDQPISAKRKTPPTVDQPAPAKRKTPPTVDQSAPAKRKTPPTVDQSAPAKRKTPPTVDQPAPAKGQTPLPVETTTDKTVNQPVSTKDQPETPTRKKLTAPKLQLPKDTEEYHVPPKKTTRTQESTAPPKEEVNPTSDNERTNRSQPPESKPDKETKGDDVCVIQ